MGLFAGIKNAPRRLDSNYEKPGTYWERIDACKDGKSRKGDDFVVLEKTVIRVIDDAEGEGHRLGENISHMLMKKYDSFLSNVKTIIANIMDIPGDEVTEALCEEVFCPESIIGGFVVECSNRNIVTKKGTDFTAITYKREVPPQEVLETLSEEDVERFFKTDTMSGAEWLQALADAGSE
jgi:hypothetical protein